MNHRSRKLICTALAAGLALLPGVAAAEGEAGVVAAAGIVAQALKQAPAEADRLEDEPMVLVSPSSKQGYRLMSKSEVLAKADAMLKKATHGRAEARDVVPGYFGMIGVVTGLALAGEGSPTEVLWILPDFKGLVAGSLILNDGTDLTAEYNITYGLPKTQVIGIDSARRINLPENLHAAAARTKGVDMNPGHDKVLYVLFSTTCPVCRHAFDIIDRSRPIFDTQGVTVRYLPVGDLDRGLKVLAGGYPALMALVADQEADVALSPELSRELGHAVRLNNEILQSSHKRPGTPTFIWLGAAGARVQPGFDGYEDLGPIIADMAAAKGSFRR